jgi:ubiquinone/menaquinone biosynthesis C-methylase UbiE
METNARSWAFDPQANNPFAHPRGWLGRFAGRIMRWTNKQDAVLDLLDVRPGDHVLEVGYGPGELIRLLSHRTDASRISGVDPSPAMRDLAARRNRSAVRSGRVRLLVGSAEQLDLPDAGVDRVVAVNNVAIWPDLDAGVRELGRVVRPGGTVVIAWHGGTSSSRIAERMRLPDDKLRRIEETLRNQFADVTRRQLARLDVFVATS